MVDKLVQSLPLGDEKEEEGGGERAHTDTARILESPTPDPSELTMEERREDREVRTDILLNLLQLACTMVRTLACFFLLFLLFLFWFLFLFLFLFFVSFCCFFFLFFVFFGSLLFFFKMTWDHLISTDWCWGQYLLPVCQCVAQVAKGLSPSCVQKWQHSKGGEVRESLVSVVDQVMLQPCRVLGEEPPPSMTWMNWNVDRKRVKY